MIENRTRTATTPKKHLFTNIPYCEECQKGMWFKANQKGYRCGGNIRHGDTFCLNKVAVREKELMHVIMEDLKALFNSLKEETFLNSLLNKLNVKKRNILKELEKVQSEIEKLRNKKLKDVLNLKELTPQVLHSLVEKITCKNDGTVHIQYSFVNPLQDT
ncbi:recombinase zinc beta ribbon domain-containing protein [Peribacillus asahii]|uniref:recombinase zinc beta ribbon domain-containing protein n=1 Tax=Peribacillus asahii TaxID=228899 RepID=UPI003824EE3E